MAGDHHNLEKPTSTKDPIVVAASGGEVAAESCAKSEEESNKQLDQFTGDEETLIIRMYNLVGERWSLIAGRIPGRSAQEIEKYWNSRHATSK